MERLDERYDTGWQETEDLYTQMETAAKAWRYDSELEYWIRKQLKAYLGICSGSRMMRDYLNYLFDNA